MPLSGQISQAGQPSGAGQIPRRILCLWLPWFPTDRITRNPDKDTAPALALTKDLGGRVTITAVNAAANAAGLSKGMALADARALVPDLAAQSAQPAEDAQTLRQIGAWCLRYTPWAAVADEDSLYLDITGCAHLFGGETPLTENLIRRLDGLGFTACAAIADTVGAAWAFAHYAQDGHPITILPPEQNPAARKEHLAALPVAALRLSWHGVEALMDFGLRRIGDLYALPRGALTERFGEDVIERIDQALGHDDEPISPTGPAPCFETRLTFSDPLVTAEGLARAVQNLLANLCQDLAKAGQGARRLTLTCRRVDGAAQALTIGTSRPLRDPRHLARLFQEKLAEIAPGFGIEIMAMTAEGIAPLTAAQYDWHGADNTGEENDLAALVDRLGNRFGFRHIARLVPQESWLPERAVTLHPPLTAPKLYGWPEGRARPLRLLSRPEVIDAVALTPDDPPRLFRWRGQSHAVRSADGPERLSAEWWQDKSQASHQQTRDYYRVEDRHGRRFWLYREGLYTQSGAPPRWFLHGFFG